MCQKTMKVILCSCFVIGFAASLFAADSIPPWTSWTDRGTVIAKGAAGDWDGSDGALIVGLTRKDNTLYLFYNRGWRGCWEADRKGSHTALGVATSTNGTTWTEYSGNPVLKPHDFKNVSSHENGIRHGVIHYIPSLGKFRAYFGIDGTTSESQTCNYMQSCSGCDVSVDAIIYAAESNDGYTWTNLGIVANVGNANGRENHAKALVTAGSTFYLYTFASDAKNAYMYSGTNWKSFSSSQFMYTFSTAVGEFQEAYLHTDGSTITLFARADNDWTHGGWDMTTTTTSNAGAVGTWTNFIPINASVINHGKILRDTTLNMWILATMTNDLDNINVFTAPIPAAGGGGGSAPAAPSNLSATAASSSQINLTWSDNASTETGFKVYQSTTNTKPGTATYTLGANTVSKSCTGLNASTTYYFWVEAYNADGPSSAITANVATQAAGGGGSSVSLEPESNSTQVGMASKTSIVGYSGTEYYRATTTTAYVEWANVALTAGTYGLTLMIAEAKNHAWQVTVNGTSVGTLSGTGTAGWTTVTLSNISFSATNTIRLTNASGTTSLSLDKLIIQ